jgi:CheY-like chemotaxis protein
MANVLVIDDDAGIRFLLHKCLTGDGHDVREAEDGVQGVRQYRADPADLVLCDVFMPRKEGLETIRELRTLDPRARIIAMSGGAESL